LDDLKFDYRNLSIGEMNGMQSSLSSSQCHKFFRPRSTFTKEVTRLGSQVTDDIIDEDTDPLAQRRIATNWKWKNENRKIMALSMSSKIQLARSSRSSPNHEEILPTNELSQNHSPFVGSPSSSKRKNTFEEDNEAANAENQENGMKSKWKKKKKNSVVPYSSHPKCPTSQELREPQCAHEDQERIQNDSPEICSYQPEPLTPLSQSIFPSVNSSSSQTPKTQLLPNKNLKSREQGICKSVKKHSSSSFKSTSKKQNYHLQKQRIQQIEKRKLPLSLAEK